MTFYDPKVEAMALKEGAAATGWKVTKKKGALAGIGVSVSGQGAWARMKGGMAFSLRQMEKSETYQEMVKRYSISGGVSGFWGWLSIGVNASTHKIEIQKALKEMSESQEVTGSVEVDLYVTGTYPNVQVDASAYVFVLQITDEQGSSVTTFSNGSPNSDVGAQDQNGDNLPIKDNSSSINI